MPKQEIEQNEAPKTGATIIKKRKGNLLFTVLGLLLLLFVAFFAYKKIAIDYDGKYATDRLIYTDEYGFCVLITYYPQYQLSYAKGIAITHIPFGVLFTEAKANHYGNDTADSVEMLDFYKTQARTEDDNLKNKILHLQTGRSVQIGNKGKYFAITAEEFGY